MVPRFTATVLGKHSANFTHCTSCGFLQVPNPHWLDEAYSSAIASTDTGLVSRNSAIAQKLAALLYFVIPGHGHNCYLDVAGGYGLLVRLMRDYGFDFYWSDKYCDNLFAKGFEFREGETPCRAVTAIEVMEHTVDPVEFVVEALARSNSNTFIFTTELYKGDPPAPEDWWYYSLSTGQHISFFKRQTLEILSERIGMKYIHKAGLHIFTKENLPEFMTRIFMKKSIPHLSNFAAKRLSSKTYTDHEYMTSLLSNNDNKSK